MGISVSKLSRKDRGQGRSLAEFQTSTVRHSIGNAEALPKADACVSRTFWEVENWATLNQSWVEFEDMEVNADGSLDRACSELEINCNPRAASETVRKLQGRGIEVRFSPSITSI
jgi:hypothetical protein